MKGIDALREIVKTQSSPGNWNYSEYMRGLFNGLELALATMEDREPVYKEEPEQYLYNKSEPLPT